MPYQHILVAVDLTEECDPVVVRAQKLAKASGAKMSLVHIVEPMAMAFGGDVPSSDLRAMLAGNAARCYYLDLDELRPISARIGPTEADIRVPIDTLPGEAPGDAPVRSWAFRRHGAWH